MSELPIRRTKSPKAQFPWRPELWVDCTLSPGRAVAMLSAKQLQLGRGGCHESATGATGPADPWAKRLGDYHRAGRRCGPAHRTDGQDGFAGVDLLTRDSVG